MNRKDTAGYYALLGVSETASAAEIKTAFRRRAKELHPDRNSSPNAAHQFQKIHEAYQILGNSDTRARYDTLYAQIPQSELSYQQLNLEPITCSCCTKVTAQPRYVVFYQVTSFIVVTIRSPIQGIFCPTCAERKALQGTIVTWLMGWWGLPWGLIYSVPTIFQNLFGGIKPNEVNVRLLTYQAWVFATQNKFELARAVAADAQDLAREIKNQKKGNRSALGNEISDEDTIIDLLEELLSVLDTKKPIKRLKNVWSIPNRAFYMQGSILVAIAALFVSPVAYYPTETSQSSPTVPSTQLHTSNTSSPSKLLSLPPTLSLQSPPAPNVADAPSAPNSPSPPNLPSPPKPIYIRPSVADNGSRFPHTSNYIDGYPIKLTDGYSNVIVDNSQNESDVFVKLFSLNTSSPEAVRVFFIRSGDKFTVENVNVGNYDIRYRDLDSGAIVRTDPFDLSEVKTLQGVKSTEITLTLYEVYGGNMEVYPIAENDFGSTADIPNQTNQARAPIQPSTLPLLNPNPQPPKTENIYPNTFHVDTSSENPVTSSTYVQLPLPGGQTSSLLTNNNFPMNSCGELNTGQKTWYPVYVNYSEANLAKVQSLYCKDAMRKYREDIGLHSIQMASFADRQSAIDFADFMKQKMGSGEVGTSVRE